MSATDERAQFIRQQFRSVSNGPNSGIVAAYGSLAKRTDEPIATFFEAQADAQSMCDARMALLAQHNRLFRHVINGVETGMSLNYIGTSPTATVIDDEGDVNDAAMITEINLDFEEQKTNLETWGPA